MTQPARDDRMKRPSPPTDADPATLQAWREVAVELTRLQTAHPGLLRSFASPGASYHAPPFPIAMAPYGEAIAAELHERFGDWVALRVGAFAYPLPPGLDRPGLDVRDNSPDLANLDPAELGADLDGPLVIESGHVTRHGLLLTNRSAEPVGVKTNGQVTA